MVLTGSANLLMRQVSESLAGRASYLTLWPMTRREQLGLARAGGFPRRRWDSRRWPAAADGAPLAQSAGDLLSAGAPAGLRSEPHQDARVDRAELADCAHLRTFRQEYGRKARAGLLLHTFSTSLVVINEIGFEPMYRVKHAEESIYSPDPSTRTGSAGPKS